MSTYQLRTFGDLLNAIREEIQIQSTDTTALNRIRRDLNIVYQEVAGNKNWWWLEGNATVQLPVYHGSGTAAVTVGSSTVTLTVAPLGVSRKGYKFAVDGFDEIYTVESHVAGSTDLKLDREYTGASNTGASYKIWTDRVALPTDCKETIRAWHDYHSNPMDSMGMTEFRRAQGMSPRAEGKPVLYSTGDFIDALQTSAITSMPALSTRASSGVIKSLVFASTIPASITSSLSAGEPVRVRISGAGNAAYNGDFLINNVASTSVANDTLTYVAPIELQESATADTSLSINILDQENTFSRYRELYVHPAVTSGRISIHVDYVKHVLDMSSDSDEPLVPMEDRIVLYYGALAKAWRRYRNKEESDTCYQLYRDKMAQMAGKLQDSLEKPRLVPSKMYLSSKRASVTGRRPDAGYPGIGGGGSSGAIVKGTPNTVTIFNSRGETEGASVTVTELQSLSGIQQNIQTEFNSLQTQLDGKLSNADFTLLETRMDAAESDIIDLQTADSTEATARTPADTTLQTNIDSEATTRAAADTALDTRVTAIEAWTTDDVAEGATNLYYTDARADARITAQKGAASGIAPLDSSSKIDSSYLPSIAITDTFTVASEAAMLALTAERGDVAIRSDLNKSFILATDDPTDAANWKELLTPTDTVLSVNTKTGAVVLNTDDVSEGSTNKYYTDARVAASASFNTSTGHDHDGTDSKKILATNLDSTGATTGQVPKANGSGGVTWGSAGGAGGINFLTLDTSFLPTKLENFDAETSVGDWAAYADAAGTSPVDMTGGSPNTTIARDTSSPLNGLAHFTMTVNSGATRQGEGVSCVANIPPAYRGKTVSFQFPFTASGTLVDGDFVLYAYDVTNSQVITPYAAGKILGSSGTAIGTFPLPTNCTQLRVGIHVARASNTGAVTIKFDDVKVTPDVPAIGMAGGDWQAYTPTFTGLGTVTSSLYWRQVGDSIEIAGRFTTGTVTATAATFTLPNALVSGFAVKTNVGYSIRDAATTLNAPALYADPASNTINFAGGLGNATNSPFTSITGSSTFNNSETVSVFARLKIQGWSANVTMGQSSTFRMSSILANGSRVTGSAPTALGQYRSYLRNASANTFTETNGSPSTAPSASNGISLTCSSGWATADASGQPSRYDIFVGKNKSVRLQWYASTGMTGAIDVTPFVNSSTDVGVHTSYDPTTGIVSLSKFNAGSASAVIGYTYSGTGAISSVNSAYFDIIVSENALAVGIQAPRSEIHLDTHAGYGSTNTQIPYYSNSSVSGTALVLTTNNSTSGASVTVIEDGLYDMGIEMESPLNDTQAVGVTLNSSSLTTAINSITNNNERLCLGSITAGAGDTLVTSAHRTKFLTAGSVIRPHGRAKVPATSNRSRFWIVKVSN